MSKILLILEARVDLGRRGSQDQNTIGCLFARKGKVITAPTLS